MTNTYRVCLFGPIVNGLGDRSVAGDIKLAVPTSTNHMFEKRLFFIGC
ncbi:MAG: hypothetical protein AAGF78_15175 [Pseudomonadota bacterium]